MDLIDVRDVRVARARGDLRFGAGEVPLGGGTWLYSEPQPGTLGLVDLTGLGWDPLVVSPAGLTISATCTVEQLATMPAIEGWNAQPLFALCADALLASWKIQRVATVGGNICTALPAGPMTSLTAALDGVAVIWHADGTDSFDGTESVGTETRMPVASFVTGVQSTALRHGDVLRAIELPDSALRARVGMRRISLSPLGRSGALVIARLDADGTFTVTVTASTPRPRVFTFAGIPAASELSDAIDAVSAEPACWYDDPHGAPDWRRAMSLRFAEELRVELGGAL